VLLIPQIITQTTGIHKRGLIKLGTGLIYWALDMDLKTINIRPVPNFIQMAKVL
jgi:hypothetical protein